MSNPKYDSLFKALNTSLAFFPLPIMMVSFRYIPLFIKRFFTKIREKGSPTKIQIQVTDQK